jgi:hypothetical protein
VVAALFLFAGRGYWDGSHPVRPMTLKTMAAYAAACVFLSSRYPDGSATGWYVLLGCVAFYFQQRRGGPRREDFEEP